MNRADLVSLLAPLRLRGNDLIVHTSLSAFGAVEGGAETLCRTLFDVVTPSGTIVVPTFTYETFVETGPAAPRAIPYHPDLPVSREIGVVSETFRRLPGVVRSNHPTHSFAAWGRLALDVLSTQRDNNPLGALKKLNVLRGHVLLLGAGLEAATAIHLAEEQAELPYLSRRTALRINDTGHEERVVLERVPGCSAGFGRLERDLDEAKIPRVPLATGEARKIPLRHLLTVAAAALGRDPLALACGRPECPSCGAKRQSIRDAESSIAD